MVNTIVSGILVWFLVWLLLTVTVLMAVAVGAALRESVAAGAIGAAVIVPLLAFFWLLMFDAIRTEQSRDA